MSKFKEALRGLPFYNTAVLPVHFVKALAAAIKYKFPARKLTVIGVTGTNGKTTTSFMIWKMLSEAGYKTGLITTVAWGVEELENQVEHMTTVDPFQLNQRIAKIKERGAEFLVLEVTSHAMCQFRTLGIPIEVAVMTNVTHDHLDYHKTFNRYVNAKRKLFKKAKFGVVNAEDKSGIWFMQDTPEYLTYGLRHGRLKAHDIKLGVEGVSYATGHIRLRRSEKSVGSRDGTDYRVGEINITTQIPGEFNVFNSLAATAVGLRLGLSEAEIEQGITALESVEGRMNRINLGQDFGVIVDYAHTPDAFLKVFQSVGHGVKGRIITLTGGAGRRDETTRAERGELAAKYSDIIIITEDDSRDEDPKLIASQFVRGAEKAGKVMDEDLFVELSRSKAIIMAIKEAKKGDLVLILGKGHEKTILRADGPHAFEDLKVTRRAVEKKLEAEKARAAKTTAAEPKK